MSRWIDADALKEKIDNIWNGRPLSVLGARILTMIDEAPSIDICFCKECNYKPICSHSVQHTTHEPTSVTIGYKSVDFCSYGEREGE